MITINCRRDLLLLLLLSSCLLGTLQADGIKKLYIVYMGEKKHENPNLVTAVHHDTLASLLGSKNAALDSIVYSYKHGFSGFAAMLTESQAEELAELPDVIRVTPSRKCQVQTTRSWDFLQLDVEHQKELLQMSNWGDDSIIGIIDTGIIPEAESFNDHGYGPIPSRWKGKCVPGQEFKESSCSKKIIGARWYTGGVEQEYIDQDYLSARGVNPHGTHTASTAAGSFVQNASCNGLASGQARGGAPRARIAVYKALWGHGGHGTDAAVVAAIDDAIHDGVDILSLSLGSGTSFEGDSSFASLDAVMKGIVMVYSAGNTGPKPHSASNLAPWAITVAATNLDRAFPTVMTLGNNQTLVPHPNSSDIVSPILDEQKILTDGQIISRIFTIGAKYTIQYRKKDTNCILNDCVTCVVGQAMYYGSAKRTKYEEIVFGDRCDEVNVTEMLGKVVLCQSGSASPKGQFLLAASNVIGAGGKGLIFAQYTTNYLEEGAEVCKFIDCKEDIPLVHVDIEIGTLISLYIRNSKKPVVKISPTTTVTGSQVYSPKVASFSSRGPNVLIPAILKPDIAAPGVSILASLGKTYGFKSGTSMATPHIAGIAALLKSMHPDWSPAEIKSALVTTASTNDRYGMPMKAEGIPRKIADPFDYGGGQANPNRAADPGLVYDIDPKDYKGFFHCTYGKDIICSSTQMTAYTLNLPSITIPDLKTSVTVSRTVKNVGDVNALYRAIIQPPPGIEMEVRPKILLFNADTKTQKFEVTLSSTMQVQGDYTFGSLTWSDTKHTVRIPISVRTVVQDFYADVA